MASLFRRHGIGRDQIDRFVEIAEINEGQFEFALSSSLKRLAHGNERTKIAVAPTETIKLAGMLLNQL